MTDSLFTKDKYFVKCDICKKTYTDPRLLPCLHTFCMSCLQTVADLKCPKCFTVVPLFKDEVSSLPVNYFISNICSITNLANRCQETKICDYCFEVHSKETTASNYCFECESKLCDSCLNYHSKTRANARHYVITIKELSDEQCVQEVLKKYVLNCEIHEDKPAELYCFDDKKLICMICFAEEHSKHEKCMGINKTGDIFRGEIKTEREKLKLHRGKLANLLKDVRKYKEEYKESVRKVENEINLHTEKLIQEIQDQRKAALHQLNNEAEMIIKKFEDCINSIEVMMANISSLSDLSDQLLTLGSNGVVAEWNEKVKNRCDAIVEGASLVKVFSYHCDFRSADLSVVGRDKQYGFLGEIHTRNRTYPLKTDFPIEFESTASLSAPSGVVGVTTLNRLIYVITNSKAVLYVYDPVSYSLSSLLNISTKKTQLRSNYFGQFGRSNVFAPSVPTSSLWVSQSSLSNFRAEDMTSSQIMLSLFIANSSGSVFCIDSSGTVTYSWQSGVKPTGLCLIKNSGSEELLIIGCNQLLCFTLKGNPTRQIGLPSGFKANHALQNNEGKYLVCDSQKGAIYVINNNGIIEKELPLKAVGSETKFQFNPVHLSLLSANGRNLLLVADSGANTVSAFEPSTLHCQLQMEILQRPYRLCFEESTGKLIVACSDGSLFIYQGIDRRPEYIHGGGCYPF